MSVIDTSESFRSIMDKILLRPIGRAMANPLSLALMISIVIMLVVRFTYDDDHLFRTSLRVFGICTAFLFINNHVLINDMNSRQLNPDQRNVIRTLESARIQSRPAPGDIFGGENGDGDDDDDDDNAPMVVSSGNTSRIQGDASRIHGSNILERLPDASTLVTRA